MRGNTTKSTSVRLNLWAYDRLEKVFKTWVKRIKENPEAYPSLAGRRVTFSDVIILMCEREDNESARS